MFKRIPLFPCIYLHARIPSTGNTDCTLCTVRIGKVPTTRCSVQAVTGTCATVGLIRLRTPGVGVGVRRSSPSSASGCAFLNPQNVPGVQRSNAHPSSHQAERAATAATRQSQYEVMQILTHGATHTHRRHARLLLPVHLLRHCTYTVHKDGGLMSDSEMGETIFSG